jgi:fibrillarin-like rRNA methylase
LYVDFVDIIFIDLSVGAQNIIQLLNVNMYINILGDAKVSIFF